jgi:Methylase involved in ubiquinone/menaquinone biosynthesis
LPESWVWDRYWQYDRIASCFDGAGAGNYNECVAAGWRSFFSNLSPNARILDLCTGNGAIALIAAEVGRADAKSFTITAVDQADIDPPSYVARHRDQMRGIRFVGRTNVEDLPFADGSFDAAVSQYGLEYSDVDRAVAGVARVLAPGGMARFVVHASDGVIASGSRAMIDDAEHLLGRIDLVGETRRCLDAVRAVESGDDSPAARQKAKEAVAAFQGALKLTANYVPHAADKVMIRNTGGVLLDAFNARQRVGHDAVLAKVDHVEMEILAHRGRLEALVKAAVDATGAKAVAVRLRDSGAIDTSCDSLENADGLIGYVVTARFA